MRFTFSIIIAFAIILTPTQLVLSQPIPEPEQDKPIGEKCGPGTVLQDGVCIVNSENELGGNNVKWEDPFNEKLPPPNLEPTRDYDFGLIYLIVFVTVIIVGGIIFGIIFVIRRRK